MRFMSIIIIGLFFLFSCSETPNQAPVDSYRDVEVRVDMSNQINNNLFNPETDNLTLYLDSLHEFEMIDDDNDNIFTYIISDLIFGQVYQYEYAINSVFENIEGQRFFTVNDSNNLIHDYYGELNPTTLTFYVNMSYQIQLGNFDSNNQVLNIVGDLNDWAGQQLSPDEDDESVYMITITDIEIDQEIVFKFRIDEESWETPNPDVSDCVDDGFGGNNRYYLVEQGENILEYWYNDDSGS